MSTLLEARHVTKVFTRGIFARQRTVALENFSLTIPITPPSVTAIVGESGSGKTTLARLLLGLLPPTTGDILYAGKSLRTMSRGEWQAFRRDVQVVFQDPYDAYNPFYKVDHVLSEPIVNFRLATSAAERNRLIENALEAVGLRPEETLGRYPHQLSGGQRQRIMIARAILVRPRLIIADEPVSMVDASLRATILRNFRALHHDLGISLIYITHDLATAYQISKNIIVLYNGSVAEAGDIDLVVQHPKHPYTQLLISSIPLPDPKRRWGTAWKPLDVMTTTPDGGCKFVNRCPHAMAICRMQPPPLFRTEEHRVTACYLYRENAVVANAEMDTVFAR